jgi:hypothetical protein
LFGDFFLLSMRIFSSLLRIKSKHDILNFIKLCLRFVSKIRKDGNIPKYKTPSKDYAHEIVL